MSRVLGTRDRAQSTRRLYESVVDQVLALVEAEGLHPGDALPTERALAERFGVSRNVLRQAFSVLEERGMLRPLRGSGRYLRATDAVDGVSGLGLRAQVELASIADLLEARLLCEVPVAEMACQRRTSDEAASLALAARTLDTWEDNVTFHAAVAACTHNFVLERTVRDFLELASALRQRRHYEDQHQLDRMRGEHMAIAAAVTARDVGMATQLTREHLEGTNRELHPHQGVQPAVTS